MTPTLTRLLRVLPVEWANADLRRCLRNAAYNTADHLTVPLLWLVTTPVVLARLGQDLYGIWMLVSSVFGFGGVLSFGLADATVRYVAKYRARQDVARVAAVLQTTVVLYGALGLLAGAGVFLLAPAMASRWFNVPAPLQSAAQDAFRLAGAGLSVRFLFSILQSGVWGFERYDAAARISMGVTVATTLGGLAAVLLGHGLRALVLVNIAAMLGGAVALAALLKVVLIRELRFLPRVDGAVVREVFAYGFFSWTQSVVSSIGQNLDNFLLASVLSPTAVTYYAVSRRVSLQAHALLSRASAFLFPFSGALAERGERARLKQVYEQTSFAVMVLSTGLLVPIFVFGDNILSVWLGPAFAAESGAVLRILCLRYVLVPAGIVNYHYLLGTGHARSQAVIGCVTTFVAVVAMWFLVNRHQVMGAAYAHLVNAPLVLLSVVYVRRLLFGAMEIGATLAYLVPVVVMTLAAAAAVRWAALPSLHLPGLLAALAAATALSSLVALGIGRLCQRWGWMPR